MSSAVSASSSMMSAHRARRVAMRDGTDALKMSSASLNDVCLFVRDVGVDDPEDVDALVDPTLDGVTASKLQQLSTIWSFLATQAS